MKSGTVVRGAAAAAATGGDERAGKKVDGRLSG